MLDLLQEKGLDPVPIPELRHVTARMAEAYAGKTLKTIQRDVDMLIRMGLAVKTEEGVRAKLETMLAFLPPTRESA